MATKPSSVPEWATGGGAALLEPLLAEKQLGWVPGSRGPAQWFNWWMKLVYLWMVWLDAFESEAHTWSALQTFSAKIVSNWGSGGTDAAVYGHNTSIGIGGFPGVRGESDNGIGVDGIGKICGVFGTDLAGSAASSAGVVGASLHSSGFGGWFYNDSGGTALKASTAAGGTPGTALQVFGNGFYGAEINGPNSIGLSVITTAGGAGSNAIEAFGGLIGVRGRPVAGSNGTGVKGEGQGTGPGVEGVGGVSSDGVRGTGGSGAGGAGGRFTGTGASQGIVAVGSNSATGVGGEFGRGDADHTKPAITCVGAMALVASTDIAGGTAILNELHRKLVVKAWALIQLNNTANPTILDRMNISAVAQQTVGNGIITFTMAQAMAGTSYGIIREVDANISNARVARATPSSTTQFVVEVYDPSAPTVVLTAANSNNYIVFVAILGAQ